MHTVQHCTHVSFFFRVDDDEFVFGAIHDMPVDDGTTQQRPGGGANNRTSSFNPRRSRDRMLSQKIVWKLVGKPLNQKVRRDVCCAMKCAY